MAISKITAQGKINTDNISNKKVSSGFKEQFSNAFKKETDKQLEKLLHSIKKSGREIIESQSITSVHKYKEEIKEYLSFVLKDAYRVAKLRSMYNGNSSTIVQIINKELDKLTQTVLSEEKGTLAVANMIEHIEGLLVDIYK
ncbi:MAG: YaaR family protein [Clostridiales bacterium]|nr:YaaR family protein [Clostridiales bacterium]HBM80875.1 hypothetical protein [Clostridiaceae bacterium]